MPTLRIATPRGRHALLGVLAIALALLLAGCGDAQPSRISAAELAGAQKVPYYNVHRVGPSFQGKPLTAADGVDAYKPSTGDSVYYGDCVSGNGILGSKGCLMPLKVSTVVYSLHSNVDLATQRNAIVRGVPASIFDEGRAIELFTGRLTIEIESNTAA